MSDFASKFNELGDDIRRARLAIAKDQFGPEIAELLKTAHRTAQEASARAERLEREVWALSYVVGDMMDGARPDDVVNDLPSEARRKVIACRHQGGPLGFVKPSDQFGPLPKPPPRASVMRESVRTVDADSWEHPRGSGRAVGIIEGSWEESSGQDLRQPPD